MADVPEFHLAIPNTFSDGTDTYKGVEGFTYQSNPLPRFGKPKENELRPTRLEQGPSNASKYSGQIVMAGPNSDALLDTVIASATMLVRDITTASATKTATFTNLFIRSVSSGAQKASNSSATYSWEADDFDLTDTP